MNGPRSELHKIVENAPDLAPATRNKYLRDLNAWLEFAGENPNNWTQPRAEEFYRWLLDDKNLRPQSANRLMASIKYAAKWWSISKKQPDLNFTQIRTMGSRNRIGRQPLSQEEAMLLLSSCDQSPHGLRDFALFVVSLETGMRRISLEGMTFENTTWEPGLTRVPTKGSNGELRDVILTPTAVRALQPWRMWLGSPSSGFVFCPLVGAYAQAKRYWKPLSKPLTGGAIHKIVKQRSMKLGLEHGHPHMFRHAFTTWRINAGHPPHEVASVTGHSLPGLGAMAGYIDRKVVAENMRHSTPAWLFELVADRCG